MCLKRKKEQIILSEKWSKENWQKIFSIERIMTTWVKSYNTFL
jgi:hypothetical protein